MFETVLSACIGTFEVDTGAIAVNVDPSVNPDIFKTPSGEYRFEKKDNVLFKSYSIVLPYCFTLADDRASVDVTFWDSNAAIYRNVTELDSIGRIWAFSENVEIELQTFWKWNNTYIPNEDWTWFAGQANQHISWVNPTSFIRISMLNCPAILHETIQPVFCFIKVIHTKPLTAPAP